MEDHTCIICDRRVDYYHYVRLYGYSYPGSCIACLECLDAALVLRHWRFVDVYQQDNIDVVIHEGEHCQDWL